MKTRIIKETDYGVYLWQMPDGALVCDEEKNFLSISSKKGDPRRIDELTAAARTLGLDTGHPIFFPGHRKINDEEYQRQKARMEDGLIPDEYDAGAWADEIRYRELRND